MPNDTIEVIAYWAALSLSFRRISNVNEHNSLGSPGKVIAYRFTTYQDARRVRLVDGLIFESLPPVTVKIEVAKV